MAPIVSGIARSAILLASVATLARHDLQLHCYLTGTAPVASHWGV
jgi:hypothetical protein